MSDLSVRGSLDHLHGVRACGGRFVLEEPLFGAPEESVWLGSGEEGPVLVTLGLRTGLTRAELEELLALPFPGITPLVAVGELDQPGPEADNVVVVVEMLPAGVVSTQAFAALRGDARLRAGQELAVAVGRAVLGAHDAYLPVAGVRPDAVWVREGNPAAFAALAPRAARLWALRQSVDAGVAPGHLAVFEPPELLDGAGPTRPDDVFSLAASFWWWATGQHPFSDGGRDEQVLAILMGERRPWPGPPSLEPMLSMSLGPRVGRPSLITVVELLAPT
jgi:hypothetical protein